MVYFALALCCQDDSFTLSLSHVCAINCSSSKSTVGSMQVLGFDLLERPSPFHVFVVGLSKLYAVRTWRKNPKNQSGICRSCIDLNSMPLPSTLLTSNTSRSKILYLPIDYQGKECRIQTPFLIESPFYLQDIKKPRRPKVSRPQHLCLSLLMTGDQLSKFSCQKWWARRRI